VHSWAGPRRRLSWTQRAPDDTQVYISTSAGDAEAAVTRLAACLSTSTPGWRPADSDWTPPRPTWCGWVRRSSWPKSTSQLEVPMSPEWYQRLRDGAWLASSSTAWQINDHSVAQMLFHCLDKPSSLSSSWSIANCCRNFDAICQSLDCFRSFVLQWTIATW